MAVLRCEMRVGSQATALHAGLAGGDRCGELVGDSESITDRLTEQGPGDAVLTAGEVHRAPCVTDWRLRLVCGGRPPWEFRARVVGFVWAGVELNHPQRLENGHGEKKNGSDTPLDPGQIGTFRRRYGDQ